MDKIKKLKNYIIHIGLIIVITLLVFYIFCTKFRLFLEIQGIDPNFIIGFFTVMALFLSLIQSSKDKKYAYNLRLIESIEDKGLKVISKLISIKSKSYIYLEGIKMHKKILNSKLFYEDTNETMSKKDVEGGMDLVATYIDTYFPEQNLKWNNLQDKLSQMATSYATIALNYSKNIEVLKDPLFKNKTLDNIDNILKDAENINNEIEKITLEIRNDIIEKINMSKGEFKKTFDFRF
ncbi:MAG: hypothetical protein WC447_00780 [Candidatus Paceibacterota bacterium]|jgi:hypothetical protein